MKLHRFFIDPKVELKQDFWIHDERLIHQWLKVLRYSAGQQLILFDGANHDRLYKIQEIKLDEAHLVLITEFERKLPVKNIYLFWSLLKKDKNDWVIQKTTELGVSHFIPLICDRTEKTGFDEPRAKKIIIEATEQCGRSDIPSIREPITLQTAISEFNGKIPLIMCQQGDNQTETNFENVGILIGPEGGWSDDERNIFVNSNIPSFNIHDFTLRAETAAIAAVAKLIQ